MTGNSAHARWLPWALVGGLTLVGLVFRLVMFNQSTYGDEMSTLWIIKGNDFSGVISIVRSDAEISPPFFFLLAEASSVFGDTISAIRLPSLVAGVAVIPVFYLVGLRTLGRRGAIYATAVASVSPFLIFYSANARGYSVMILMAALSALALLVATSDKGRWWHWLGFFVAAALSVYSHYVGALAIAGEVLWVLAFFPAARVKVLAWSMLAVLIFAPWVGAFRADLDSPTNEIMQALQAPGLDSKLDAVWNLFFLRSSVGPAPLFWHRPDMLLGIAALLTAAAGIAGRLMRGDLSLPRGERGRSVMLAVLVTGTVFGGELLMMAAGSDIFGTRNLAPAWAGLPLLLAAAGIAAGRRTGLAAMVLLCLGLTGSSLWMADSSRSTINYNEAADLIESRDTPGGTVLDGSVLSPAPQTPLDAYLDTDMKVFSATPLQDRPDYVEHMFEGFDAQKLTDQAFSGPGPVEVVTVTDERAPYEQQGPDGSRYQLFMNNMTVFIPSGWVESDRTRIEGRLPLTVTRFERSGAADGQEPNGD